MQTFQERVLQVVSKIPKGKTLTYKQVAQKAGSFRTYRAVGNILSKNLNPKIPCHRATALFKVMAKLATTTAARKIK